MDEVGVRFPVGPLDYVALREQQSLVTMTL